MKKTQKKALGVLGALGLGLLLLKPAKKTAADKKTEEKPKQEKLRRVV